MSVASPTLFFRTFKRLKPKKVYVYDAMPESIFKNGTEISSRLKNNGLEKVYLYKGEYIVITGVGSNGFIVSVYPGGGSK